MMSLPTHPTSASPTTTDASGFAADTHRLRSRNTSKLALGMTMAAACLLVASVACAQEPTHNAEPEEPHHGENKPNEGEHEAHHGEHEAAHTPWVAGLKAVQLTSLGEEETTFGVGGGFSFERDVVHGWVEAELVAAVVLGEELVIPADLVLKKPFHFGIFGPYIGAGLALTILPEEGEVFVGGSLVGGSYFWLWGDIGLDLEFEYNVIQEEEELVQEIVVGLGPSVRF